MGACFQSEKISFLIPEYFPVDVFLLRTTSDTSVAPMKSQNGICDVGSAWLGLYGSKRVPFEPPKHPIEKSGSKVLI